MVHTERNSGSNESLHVIFQDSYTAEKKLYYRSQHLLEDTACQSYLLGINLQ